MTDWKYASRAARRAIVWGIGGWAAGCTCGGADTATPEVEAPVEAEAPLPVAPEAMLQATWVVHFAATDALAPVSGPGWIALITERNIRKAIEASGDDPVLAARAHAEAAALFDQGALIAGHSFLQVYEATPEPTDPVGAQHLIAVSHALLGDLGAARVAAGKVPADDVTAAFHAPWKAWLATPEPVWPPDLKATGAAPPEAPARGVWPTSPPPPHYELPELGTDSRRTMADPAALLALGEWHRQALASVGPAEAKAAAALRVGYGLPGAASPAAPGDLDPLMLFGTNLLVASDADFLVALHGDAGITAVDAFADRSLLAWLARESRGAGGMIDPDRASSLVADMRERLLQASTAKTGGTMQGHQRVFADLGASGALWSLALVAEVAGDRETSGRLRLQARDRTDLGNHLKDPVSLLSLAAWDASNRNVHRAPELLHNQTGRYPELEVARYGLDVLALRVQKERIETSGM